MKSCNVLSSIATFTRKQFPMCRIIKATNPTTSILIVSDFISVPDIPPKIVIKNTIKEIKLKIIPDNCVR